MKNSAALFRTRVRREPRCFVAAAEPAPQRPAYREVDLMQVWRKELCEMGKFKFDVAIGNPPYQENTNDSGNQGKPLYNLFLSEVKNLDPSNMCFIIPSKWFAGGMGLKQFRDDMMNDTHISRMVDYTNAKDCFPDNSIGGGVCYFVRDKDYEGDCRFTNIRNGKETTIERPLNEFPVLVRYNAAISVLRKIKAKKERTFYDIVGPISPFNIPTTLHGSLTPIPDAVRVYYSKSVEYIPRKDITKGLDILDKYKVMLSQTSAEHAGEPNKSGKFNVLTQTMRVLEPGEGCSHSYLVIGPVENKAQGVNMMNYLKTKFVRFLVLQAVSSIHLTMTTFSFVPIQDFSRGWTDADLYEKYGITQDEVAFIDSIINPMN